MPATTRFLLLANVSIRSTLVSTLPFLILDSTIVSSNQKAEQEFARQSVYRVELYGDIGNIIFWGRSPSAEATGTTAMTTPTTTTTSLTSSSSLRWRSRVAQQTIAATLSNDNEDDDTEITYSTTEHPSSSTASFFRNIGRSFRTLISILLATSILTFPSLWALISQTSWFATLTATLQVGVALIVVWQAFGPQQHITSAAAAAANRRGAALRRKRSVLRERSEQYAQQLALYQPSVRKVQQIRNEIGLFLLDGDSSLHSTTQAALNLARVQSEAQTCLQHHVLVQVLLRLWRKTTDDINTAGATHASTKEATTSSSSDALVHVLAEYQPFVTHHHNLQETSSVVNSAADIIRCCCASSSPLGLKWHVNRWLEDKQCEYREG